MKTKSSPTLNFLDDLYDSSLRFSTTADNLTNGFFEIDVLGNRERLTHLRQAYEIYLEEAH